MAQRTKRMVIAIDFDVDYLTPDNIKTMKDQCEPVIGFETGMMMGLMGKVHACKFTKVQAWWEEGEDRDIFVDK